MIKTILCAAALILPTLVLGGIVTQRLNELETAPVVRLPIVGYDPVDLLHGHYIRLRFDERGFSNKPSYDEIEISNDDYCMCFHQNPAAGRTFSEARGEYVLCSKQAETQCDMWSNNYIFFQSAHKYFVDERYAMQLDKIVREATPRRARDQTSSEPSRVTVDVAISKSGALRLKMLYIDNKPWREVVAGAP